ncbi:MAG: phosphopantothenate/pantothenate synthetase [Euryarchaeota archaeon]|nr:phosphopantothenate/pantothenate synthetase [Euryarchaeota archaeon]
MRVPKRHPRYKSLRTREILSEMMERGIVARTGLIAHGRGEAFDYFLGERTPPEASLAASVAAFKLANARSPVISVNGNVAALAGKEIIKLSREIPAKLEVNLFHRSEGRIDLVVDFMESLGARGVLGRSARRRIPGLEQPRGRCSEGIYGADVVLVPLEDGDRAQALKAFGKLVIAIDLNPMSRTALVADVTIVDELTRSIPMLERHVRGAKAEPARYAKLVKGFDNHQNLLAVRDRMARRLMEESR